MTGAAIQGCHIVDDRKRFIVEARPKQREHSVGILCREEWQGWPMFGDPVPVGEVCFFFLEMCGIGEENPQEVRRTGCAEDRPAKTTANDQRQVARMIDMRVT